MSPAPFFFFSTHKENLVLAPSSPPSHLYKSTSWEHSFTHIVHSKEIGGDRVFREGSHQHTWDLFVTKASTTTLTNPIPDLLHRVPLYFCLSIRSTVCVNFLQTYCAAPKHSAKKKTNSSHLIWKKFSPSALPAILYIWCGFLFVQKTLESPPPPIYAQTLFSSPKNNIRILNSVYVYILC